MKHIDTRTEQIIKRTDCVNKFFADIRHYSHYSPQEQVEMCLRAQQGSQKDREELVTSNLSFIFSVCARYAEGDEILSLISYAVEGMYKAIDMFNDTYGITFLSYAVFWMQNFINHYYHDTKPLINNKRYVRFSTKIIKVTEDLTTRLERKPTRQEIADELLKQENLNFDINELQNLKYSYLEDPLGDDITVGSSEEFSALTATTNDVENTISQDYYRTTVEKLLTQLKEKERMILQMSYGIGYNREYTDEEICTQFNITPERVRQIRKNCLIKLKVRNLQYVKV